MHKFTSLKKDPSNPLVHVVLAQDNCIFLTQLKKENVELNAPPTDKLVATQLKGPDDTPTVSPTYSFICLFI